MKVAAVLTGAGGAYLGFVQDGHDVVACEPPCFPPYSGEPDVLLGSPSLGQEPQRLAEHDRFIALLADVRPRAFVLDTSPALARSKGELRAVYRALKGGGFRVSVKELDDQWLGVARSRRRLVFVGLRDDVAPDEPPPFPKPSDRRTTVADVCPWVVASRERRVTFSTLGDDDSETFLDPAAPLPSNVRSDVRFDVLVGGSRYPRRGLAMAELRRIAGYPDGFPLVGLRSEQVAALDSTASPPMARAVARELAGILGDPR
jgi:DNA (cytosine-5)-methyltransferase 1